jgi:DNA polymerase III epsilon subunit-like protein
MFESAVVFLDLETTGASADRDRIIEVGLIEVLDGEYVDEWSTLVNPGKAIPSGHRQPHRASRRIWSRPRRASPTLPRTCSAGSMDAC